MSLSFRASVLALACTAGVLAATAVPALADTPLGHSGKVGAHSLSDSASSPGTSCQYKYHSGNNSGDLVKIVVKPPNVRAVAGNNSQTVGWRFTVQRRVQGEGGATQWVQRFTSPEMTAVTDDSHNASFNSASVPVRTGPFLAGGVYQYRVIVTTIWHRGDGSTQGKAKNRVDFYAGDLDTGGSNIQDEHCTGWLHADQFS